MCQGLRGRRGQVISLLPPCYRCNGGKTHWGCWWTDRYLCQLWSHSFVMCCPMGLLLYKNWLWWLYIKTWREDETKWQQGGKKRCFYFTQWASVELKKLFRASSRVSHLDSADCESEWKKRAEADTEECNSSLKGQIPGVMYGVQSVRLQI